MVVSIVVLECCVDYETVGILPLISRKTLGILGDGGLVKACVA